MQPNQENFHLSTKQIAAAVGLSPKRVSDIRDRYCETGIDYIVGKHGVLFADSAIPKLKNRNTARGFIANVPPKKHYEVPVNFSISTDIIAQELQVSRYRAYEVVVEHLIENTDYVRVLASVYGKRHGGTTFFITAAALEKLQSRPFQGRGGNRKKQRNETPI